MDLGDDAGGGNEIDDESGEVVDDSLVDICDVMRENEDDCNSFSTAAVVFIVVFAVVGGGVGVFVVDDDAGTVVVDEGSNVDLDVSDAIVDVDAVSLDDLVVDCILLSDTLVTRPVEGSGNTL